MMFSTSSSTLPASVSVVASAIVNGTSRMRASVCASSVLPQPVGPTRSEEHTSELQSLMRISYAVFCLKKKNKKTRTHNRMHNKTETKFTSVETDQKTIDKNHYKKSSTI